MIGKNVIIWAYDKDNSYHVLVKSITRNGIVGTHAGNYRFSMPWDDINRITVVDYELRRREHAARKRASAEELLLQAERLENQ